MCPAPQPITHAAHNYNSARPIFLVGTQLTFTCDDGTKVPIGIPSETVECQHDLTFPATSLTCQGIIIIIIESVYCQGKKR